MRIILVFMVALLFGACSSKQAPAPSTSGPSTSTPSTAHLTFSFQTPAGTETHWCQYVRLPKGASDKIMLTGYSWTMSSMHHWTLFRTTPDLPSDVSFDQPFDCFAPNASQYMQAAAITQEFLPQSQMSFGAGNGFALDSGGVIVFQAHTVNPTAETINPTITLDLDLADPSEVPNKLGLIQFYDPYIIVPPNSPATAHMRCPIPQDLTVIRRWGHIHAHGVSASVFLDPPGGPEGTDPVSTVTNWDDPTISTDTLLLPQGSDVRMICNYQGSDTVTIQGPDKLDNEMCMFIAYYYPEISPDAGQSDFENCINGDWYGVGTHTCADMLACVQACPSGSAPDVQDTKVDVGQCWQQCVVDSCPTASTQFGVLRECIQQNCVSECATFGDTCSSCVATSCLSAYAACETATCTDN